MQFKTLLAAVAAVASVAAVPLEHTHALHEKRNYVPETWFKSHEAKKEALVPVRIGLTQSNLDQGHDLLMEVSDPDSPKYSQHYTAEEVAEIFAPSAEAVQSVRDWLESSGISGHRVSQSWNKQWMQFDAKVHELNELLKTTYYEHIHKASQSTHVACDEYYVPHHVAKHVDYITPGIKLFTPERKRGNADAEKRDVTEIEKRALKLPPLKLPLPAALSDLLSLPLTALCAEAITPDCISTLYNISAATTAVKGNQLGIFEDLGDHYSKADLKEFFLTLAPQIPVTTLPENRLIDGASANSKTVAQAGPESDLDFQISYPIIYPQNSVLFQTDDDPTENNYTYAGFLNNFLDAIDGSYCTYSAFGETGNSKLDPPYPDPKAGGYKGQLQCGKYKPTNVISISYGGQEPDLPMSYQRRQCNEFMKLGMQGVSVFVASGDSGVAGYSPSSSDNGCIKQTIFNPDFPATCPYITTVGATLLPTGSTPTAGMEVAVTRFGSGGGFSNIYPRPAYQNASVNTYLTQHKPSYPSYSTQYNQNIGANGGLYNSNGRGYPDISAIGDNVIIFNIGAPTLIGGTSASSPLFAAVLTRINDVRLKAGKKPVGFVNPTLYKNPGALNDVVTGNNPGCGTNGFSAAKGWDPVTGLGSPNYPKLLKVFSALP